MPNGRYHHHDSPLTAYSTISTTDSKKYPHAVRTRREHRRPRGYSKGNGGPRCLAPANTCTCSSLLLAGATVYRQRPADQISLQGLAHGFAGGGFVPYFNPSWIRDGKRIIGTEVLMRWQRPASWGTDPP